jgi:hypothetical protein
MVWLFREATNSFSLLALSPPHHQKIICGTAWDDLWDCRRVLIYLLLPKRKHFNLELAWKFFLPLMTCIRVRATKYQNLESWLKFHIYSRYADVIPTEYQPWCKGKLKDIPFSYFDRGYIQSNAMEYGLLRKNTYLCVRHIPMRYSQGINIIQKKNTQGPSRKFFYVTTCGGYIPTKKK